MAFIVSASVSWLMPSPTVVAANRQLWAALRAQDATGVRAALAAHANPQVQSGARSPFGFAIEHAALLPVAAEILEACAAPPISTLCDLASNTGHALFPERVAILVQALDRGLPRSQELFAFAIAGGDEDLIRAFVAKGFINRCMDRAAHETPRPALCAHEGPAPRWLCDLFLDAPNSHALMEDRLVTRVVVGEDDTLFSAMLARPQWLSRGDGDNGARLLGGLLSRGRPDQALAALNALGQAPDERRQGWILSKFLAAAPHVRDEALRCAFDARGFTATVVALAQSPDVPHQVAAATQSMPLVLSAFSRALPPGITEDRAQAQCEADIATLDWRVARGDALSDCLPADVTLTGNNDAPSPLVGYGLPQLLLRRYSRWPDIATAWMRLLSTRFASLDFNQGVDLAQTVVRHADTLKALDEQLTAAALLLSRPVSGQALHCLLDRQSEITKSGTIEVFGQLCVRLVAEFGADPHTQHQGQSVLSRLSPQRQPFTPEIASAWEQRCLEHATPAPSLSVRSPVRL